MGVITYGMNDIGRRIDFLMQLHDLWSAGLALATQGYMTTSDKEMEVKLKNALELLNNHLVNDYDCIPYGRAINDIPKNAEDIPDDNKRNTNERNTNEP